MKRFVFMCLLAAGMVLFGQSQAQATSALHALVLNTDNIFQDDDWETLHPTLGGANSVLDIGEVLVGIFEVDQRQAPLPLFDFPAHGAGFTGIFILEVTSKSVLGGGVLATFGFGPAPAAAWTSLGLAAPAAGTMIRVVDDTTLDGQATATNSHDDFILATGTLAAGLASASGPVVAEFGSGTWSATTTDAGGAADDLTAFDTGTFTADLVLTFNGIPGLGWLDVAGLAGFQQFALRAGVLENAGSGTDRLAGVTAFPVASRTDIYVHPTPEPSSLALFAGLGCVFFAARRMRRRTAA